MKTFIPKILLTMLMVVLLSCEDDADQPVSIEKPLIQFEAEEQSVREDDGAGVTLKLVLNRPAAADGKINLKIKDDASQRIETTPAHTGGNMQLPVTKGATQVQFTVKAINNTVANDDLLAEISIEASPGFITGERDVFQLTIQNDDEPAPASSTANFVEQEETVAENREGSVEYKIQLSAPVTINSKVFIRVTSEHSNFITNPAMENEKITLTAPVGTTELSFTVSPVNDNELKGHAEIEFSILATEGSIIKGARSSQKITITDDELSGKLKGYEISAGDLVKRFYEYDSKGRISKINWETYTPLKRTGTDTYFYDDQDRVIKVNKYAGRDVNYLWSNGRIERAEVYQDGNLVEYANYAYDEQDNVAGVEPFHKQSDGSFRRGLFVVYLYFNGHNVYKSMLYQDVEGQEEPVLISTRTYEHYLSAVAPIAMFEIHPGVTAQKNLAGSYRVEENGSDIQYSLSYEFRPDGLPSKRTATSSGDTQTVAYYYY